MAAIVSDYMYDVTHTRQTLGTVNDLIEATVNDLLAIIQHRIKHNLRLFHSHRHQHGGSLDVLEVIKLGRIITEIIPALPYTQRHTLTPTHRQTNSDIKYTHTLLFNNPLSRQPFIQTILYPDNPLSRRFFIQTTLYPDDSLSRQPFIQTILYPDDSLSRRFFIQTTLYPDDSLSRQPFIQTTLYPDNPLSRQPFIQTTLYPDNPLSR